MYCFNLSLFFKYMYCNYATIFTTSAAFNAFMLFIGQQEEQPACKKSEWCRGDGMVICLGRGADLYMAQVIPLPLTVFCFSNIQIGFTLLVPAHPVSPGQSPEVHKMCVNVRACVLVLSLVASNLVNVNCMLTQHYRLSSGGSCDTSVNGCFES